MVPEESPGNGNQLIHRLAVAYHAAARKLLSQNREVYHKGMGFK